MVKPVLTLGALENAAIDRLMAEVRAGKRIAGEDMNRIAEAVAPAAYKTLLDLAGDYPFLGETPAATTRRRQVSPVALLRENLVAHLFKALSTHLQLLERNGKYPVAPQ